MSDDAIIDPIPARYQALYRCARCPGRGTHVIRKRLPNGSQYAVVLCSGEHSRPPPVEQHMKRKPMMRGPRM